MDDIPINEKEIIERVHEHLASREDLLGLAEQIGMNPNWVAQEHSHPIIFGPAEQANPFFTVYAYSRSEDLTPGHLETEFEKERAVESALRQRKEARRSLLSLKHDSFSSLGATARYHFVLDGSQKPDPFFSHKERDNFSHSPFSDIEISIPKILAFLDGWSKNPVIKRRYSSESFNLFKQDVMHSLTQAYLQEDTIPYVDFSRHFNQRSLMPYAQGTEVKTEFVDNGSLDKFVLNGVSSWRKFLSEMQNLGIVGREDAVFRLMVSTERGNKFCRLRLAEGAESSKEAVLENLDFQTRKWGRQKYGIDELMDYAKGSADPKLFVASGIEYFLLMGGFTRFFMGDDCVPTQKMERTSLGLDKMGIRPFVFGYCPHNISKEHSQDLKQSGTYSFSGGCTVLDFYEHALRKK